MNQFQASNGNPVQSVQTFLRGIANAYNQDPNNQDSIKTIVPDGIYGPETESAVRDFQGRNNLEPTGVVDNETFDKLSEAYAVALIATGPIRPTSLLPNGHVVRKGNSQDFYYPIQAIIFTLSERFDNIPGFEISNTHSDGIVEAVVQIQTMIGVSPTGEITPADWILISRLYENTIVQDIFDDIEEVLEDIADTPSPIITPNNVMNQVGRENITNELVRENNMMTPARNGIVSARLVPYPNIEDAKSAQSTENQNSALATQNTPTPPPPAVSENTSIPPQPSVAVQNEMQNNIPSNNTPLSNDRKPSQNQKNKPLRWNFY